MLAHAQATAAYLAAIDGWNRRDAEAMAACFSADATMIGFDGSVARGAAEVLAHLEPIFANHPTPPYVVIVDEAREVAPGVVMVRAEVGMVPPGETTIAPAVNAIQSCLLRRTGDQWLIELLQSTPAAFHGRPELVAGMTARLEAARVATGS
jgi:uncharacterized protein (TIGR02246 family)